MPANLPPEYFEAEIRYRQAKEIPEKIEALQAMFAVMPKHKGTDRLRAELRTKIAKLTQEAQHKHVLGRQASFSYIRKEGAGQVVLVGLPNAGKSQVVASLTGASPEVADYPFTTHTPTPGMMRFENIQVQLVDLPPITDHDAQSWLSGVLRNADALLIVVDLSRDAGEQMATLFSEMEKLKVEAVGQGAPPGSPQPIVQKRTLIVGNKSDLGNSGKNLETLARDYGGRFPVIAISAAGRAGLEEVRGEVYRALDIIRVHTKTPGKKTDMEEPVVLPRGSTVEDAAESIHKDFRHRLKYAQVWGSGKFSGQRVKRDHQLEDGDIIEFHI
ncbi:MAG: GTPase [Dehalococcoidia bacterium]